MRGTEPAVVDELHQIEQVEDLKAFVEAGRSFEANQFYVTRRKGWSGIWRHAARQLLLKLHTDRGRARQEELAAAVQEIIRSFEGTKRALESRPNASDPLAPRDVRTGTSSRPADRPPSAGRSCDISSHLPLGLRGRACHIVLEPAINPVTGGFLLDRENRPVYNQLYEPWEPERREMVASADAVAAIVAVALASEYRATIQVDKCEARTAALQADNDDLRSKLRMKTLEASLYEELYRISLAWAEGQLAAERVRIEDWIAVLDESASSSGTTALAMTEGLAIVNAALEKRGERLDQALVMVKPLVGSMGPLFERWVEQKLRSVTRTPRQQGEGKARVKVKTV